jgi:hypothetical protein
MRTISVYVTPDFGLFGFSPATACPDRIQICVEGGETGWRAGDRIRAIETGRSGKTIIRSQAERKGQKGVSIPSLHRASDPYLGDCPESEPEILEILQKGRSGRKIFVEQTTPNGFQDGFPRAEQNTLRRSNLEVGEGKSIFEIQEVMLSIRLEIPEGEPEILEKTINEDPRNIESSVSLARGP